MYYGQIKKTDIANGPGVRVSLFVSGCTRHCKNCFNPETWSFTYGKPFTPQTEEEILQALAPAYINGLSLLGGEPFEPANQWELLLFLRRVRKAYPEKDIWCYTGCTLDIDLVPGGANYTEVTEEMLAQIDVLVDGAFVEALKDITLRFCGSSNQRLIDLRASRQQGGIVLWQG
ncbi:MAG: anaerobic ribonucleoside-triphosphate reductase activating protein [Acutalibacteraceae bacterium]